jgi:hypothetical protein
MSRRQSLRLVPVRFDDERLGGSEAAHARTQDDTADDKLPIRTKPADVRDAEDELFDDLDE